MATHTQVTLTCDICGKAKDVTARTISLDGKTYEIDLCSKDDKALSKTVAGYVSHSRKVTARRISRAHSGNERTARSRAETAAVRAWAKSQGMEVSDRGRVPKAVSREYAAAH
jgi:hypothetical protein